MSARESLNPEQLKWLAEFSARQLQAIGAVRERLEKKLLPTDPLMQSVQQAFVAMQGLRVTTYYLTCDPGTVGETPADVGPR
ncbi:MAG TPA: hypothetical protein VGG19_11880 [Tepidisphaeraceae bacterium]|jgi:hypothetical protein